MATNFKNSRNEVPRMATGIVELQFGGKDFAVFGCFRDTSGVIFMVLEVNYDRDGQMIPPASASAASFLLARLPGRFSESMYDLYKLAAEYVQDPRDLVVFIMGFRRGDNTTGGQIGLKMIGFSGMELVAPSVGLAHRVVKHEMHRAGICSELAEDDFAAHTEYVRYVQTLNPTVSRADLARLIVCAWISSNAQRAPLAGNTLVDEAR